MIATPPIPKLLPFNGPPSSGDVSDCTSVEVTSITMFAGSLVVSTVIPVPEMPFIVIAFPAELLTGILPEPN